VVVHVDDFAAPDVPQWDWDRLRAQLLLPLLAGRPARYQRWDWDANSGAEWHDVPVGRIVVIEGVSSTRHEVDAPWDLTIWIDTPEPVRLDRALERDGPAMMARWQGEWLPSENAYVARENPLARVDLIVSGTEPLRPA
jgi:uridine kinase